MPDALSLAARRLTDRYSSEVGDTYLLGQVAAVS
jgi:hypothetical protein